MCHSCLQSVKICCLRLVDLNNYEMLICSCSLPLQVFAYESSGMKLGTLKSANESVTRIVVYISLLALYCLGGSKVKAVSTLFYRILPVCSPCSAPCNCKSFRCVVFFFIISVR